MAHEAFIKKFDLDNRVKTPNPGIRRFYSIIEIESFNKCLMSL